MPGSLGAFDGLYQGSNGAADASTALKGILPYAQTYYQGTSTAAPLASQITTPTATPTGGPGITKFAHFVGSAFSGGEHLLGEAATGIVHSTESMARGIVDFVPSVVHFGIDTYRTEYEYPHAVNDLIGREKTLSDQWRSGVISTNDYQSQIKGILGESDTLNKQIQSNMSNITHDSQAVYHNTIDATAAVLTVMTSGVGGLLTKAAPEITKAVDLFTGDSVALSQAENALGKLAANKTLFSKLPADVQGIISDSTTNVIKNVAPDLTAGKIARAAVVNLALKYPLLYSGLSSQGEEIFQKLSSGEYGPGLTQLGINALFATAGGPVGKWAFQGVKVGAKAVEQGIFARSSYIDELGKIVGSKLDGHDPIDLYNEIKKSPEAVKNFSANEATMLGAAGKNPAAAAHMVADGLIMNDGSDPALQTPADFVKTMNAWATRQREFSAFAQAKGLGPIATGRWTPANVNALRLKAGKIVQNSLPENRVSSLLQMWDDSKATFPNSAFANNLNLDVQVKNIFQKYGNDAAKLDDAIRGIDAQWPVHGLPASMVARAAAEGIVPIKPVNIANPFREGTGTLGTKFAEGEAVNVEGQNLFVKTIQPVPVLSWVGRVLTNAGLSTQNSTQQVYKVFNATMAEKLGESGLFSKVVGSDGEDKADYLMKQLTNQMNTINQTEKFRRAPITEVRQLLTKDIMAATGFDKNDAINLKGMLRDAMIEVPISIRGLGDRAMDVNLKYNPLAAAYSRIQGAARFSYNPVFQAKFSYKLEALGQLETGGKFPTIAGTNKVMRFFFRDQYSRLDNIVAHMDLIGAFGHGLGGEATQDISGASSNLGNQLSQSQKRIAAGVVGKMADKLGMTDEQFINNYPAQVQDATGALIHYDPKAGFLNSPLARTLNVAFFPFRFETKVAGFMAKALFKASPPTRYAVLAGMLDAHKFLDSPAGQAWYSQNADVIGLFKYFSPVATLSEVSNVLTGVDNALHGKPVYMQQFGELGGLPFGWIPQLTDSFGLTHFSAPFVNPKTGVVNKDYVPTGSYGRINAAIGDLLGSLFTYPGATVGLPSKSGAERFVTNAIDPWGKKQSQAVDAPQLTPQQQSFQQTIQSQPGKAPKIIAQPNYGSTPPQTLSVASTAPKPAPRKGKVAKKKKADFTPQLLPGQSTLGQL